MYHFYLGYINAESLSWNYQAANTKICTAIAATAKHEVQQQQWQIPSQGATIAANSMNLLGGSGPLPQRGEPSKTATRSRQQLPLASCRLLVAG